jgi:glutaconate CoA-transferase subunit A
MRTKVTSLPEAIRTIPDGALIALGGTTLHRAPCAAIHELIRQEKRRLELVKTAGSYDVDVLCGAGCASAVHAGYVGFEAVFGLAPRYRKAVEAGRITVREHACYSVIAALRASVQGVPFMPIAGMFGSDVLEVSRFQTIRDPYTGQAVVAIPRLRPDVTIVHVHQADPTGNARIYGPRFEDVLMAQAAGRVIVTCERLVSQAEMARQPELTAIPDFMVDAVVEVPHGAWPLSCHAEYDFDDDYLRAYVEAAQDDAAYARFLAEHVLNLVPA